MRNWPQDFSIFLLEPVNARREIRKHERITNDLPKGGNKLNENRPKMSGRQKNAIQAILCARSILDGCEKAGVSKSTFYTWMQVDVFRAEFERQRKLIIDEGLHKLKISADKAVDVLYSLLDSGSEVTKFRTATAILEHIGKFIETEELEKRIVAIERKISNEKH
jgi:hypothetical protein